MCHEAWIREIFRSSANNLEVSILMVVHAHYSLQQANKIHFPFDTFRIYARMNDGSGGLDYQNIPHYSLHAHLPYPFNADSIPNFDWRIPAMFSDGDNVTDTFMPSN
jgi:hypothetical protein